MTTRWQVSLKSLVVFLSVLCAELALITTPFASLGALLLIATVLAGLYVFRGGNTAVTILALGFTCFICLGLAPGIWVMNAHGVSLSRYRQLQTGMSSAEAEAILGQPHTVFRDEDGGERWVYSRGTWCQMHLAISSNGTVVSHHHDH